MSSGRDLRDAGAHQLELVSWLDPWRELADRAIEHLANPGRPFTADDVREMVGDPDRPGLMGARLPAAAKRREITEQGYRPSSRAERHAGVLAVWAGAEWASGRGRP